MRLALVRLSAAGALLAVALGGARTWERTGAVCLSEERRCAAEPLNAYQAERAPALYEQLPVALFDRWRARLRPGDRWWLDVPEGAWGGLTSRGAVYRTYGIYWFLPALPAPSRDQATVVFQLESAP